MNASIVRRFGISLARCLLAAAIAVLNLQPPVLPARGAGTIQALIDAAAPGSTVNIITGTYAESLVINKNLVLSGMSSAATFLQPPAGSRAITIIAGASKVTIQRMKIMNASLPSPSAGAGIYMANGDLVIKNSIFEANSAQYGGAIFVEAGSLLVQNTLLQGNHASLDGGAIYSKAPVTMDHVFFTQNSAGQNGGGMHVNAGAVTLIAGQFSDNTAGGNGGGLNMNDDLSVDSTIFLHNTAGADGGGVLQWNADKIVTLTNPHFENNTAAVTGGGIASKGIMTVRGGVFQSNTAGNDQTLEDTAGGGIFLQGGNLNLQGTLFDGNAALCNSACFDDGGAIEIRNQTANVITGAVFSENSGWLGGGVDQYGTPPSQGFILLTVRNSRFINNHGGYGGGLNGTNVMMEDCLFDGNEVLNAGGGLQVSGSSILDRLVITNNLAWIRSAGIDMTGKVSARNLVIVNNKLKYAQRFGSGIGADLSPSSTLEHITLSNNTGGYGIGFFVKGGQVAASNFIIDHQAVGLCLAAGAVDLNGALFHANDSSTGEGLTICPVLPVVHNAVTGDPAFAADGYHITSVSAAYNAGVTSTVVDDIDRDTRPRFGAPDLGADELVYRINLAYLTR